MASQQNKYCFVQFKFNQRTSPGQEIHITGDTPSLGQWQVEKSEKMVTNQQEYPLWKSKENIMIQQDTEIQYKYLIFNKGKFQCWENSANRHVKIGKFYKIVILDPGSKIINCISDPNLNNITNSEISKSENNFYKDDSEFINMDDIGFNNSLDINNNDIFSDQNMNTNNNEEQFILSNKKNDLFLENPEFRLHKLYTELNVDNSNSNLHNNESINNLNLNSSHTHNYNFKYINLIENIINEISPINSKIFNNIPINKNEENKEIELPKLESETEKNKLPEQTTSKNDLFLANNDENIYKKIIVCSLYLPVEIENESITPLSESLYPNLYGLKNYNNNIYFIGFIKNYKNINEKNKEAIFEKLKNEYKMYPIEIEPNLMDELFDYFNEIVNPFLNNIKINIYKIKNNNINNAINDIQLKFNQIIYKNIIELAGNEKILLLLFDYYFAFVPWLLIKGNNNDEIKDDKMEKFNNNIAIQYIFLNKIPQRNTFIKIPNYQNIIKSLLYSNIIIFPSYNNFYNFFNLVKLIDGCEYQVNNEGDIILMYYINDEKNKNDNNND